MELSKSGAIKFDHEGQTYNLMTNEYGEWSVSRGGIHLGQRPLAARGAPHDRGPQGSRAQASGGSHRKARGTQGGAGKPKRLRSPALRSGRTTSVRHLLHVSFLDGRLLPAESFIDCRTFPNLDEAIAEARVLIRDERAERVKIYSLSQDEIDLVREVTATSLV